MNIREATESWVREWNAIDRNMIAKLIAQDPDDWSEVTMPAPHDKVYVVDVPEDSDTNVGEVQSYDEETELYTIKMDDGKVVERKENEFDVERDDILPMWGTMWSFGDNADDDWLEEEDGIRKMSECRIRIYHSEEFGYFFGIDGAGYSFYESHWIPLYKAIGFHWHDDTEEEE